MNCCASPTKAARKAAAKPGRSAASLTTKAVEREPQLVGFYDGRSRSMVAFYGKSALEPSCADNYRKEQTLVSYYGA
jgi:hypothetical protein